MPSVHRTIAASLTFHVVIALCIVYWMSEVQKAKPVVVELTLSSLPGLAPGGPAKRALAPGSAPAASSAPKAVPRIAGKASLPPPAVTRPASPLPAPIPSAAATKPATEKAPVMTTPQVAPVQATQTQHAAPGEGSAASSKTAGDSHGSVNSFRQHRFGNRRQHRQRCRTGGR